MNQQRTEAGEIVVGDDVWIAANVTLVAGARDRAAGMNEHMACLFDLSGRTAALTGSGGHLIGTLSLSRSW